MTLALPRECGPRERECHIGDTRNRETDRSPVISSCRSSNVSRIRWRNWTLYMIIEFIMQIQQCDGSKCYNRMIQSVTKNWGECLFWRVFILTYMLWRGCRLMYLRGACSVAIWLLFRCLWYAGCLVYPVAFLSVWQERWNRGDESCRSTI